MPVLRTVSRPPRSALIQIACAVFALTAVCLAPADAQPATATAKPPTARIMVKDFAFTPAVLTVKPGSVVTVVNGDSVAHTVTGTGRAAFTTGVIKPGGTSRFTAPLSHGRYSYICDIHQFMSATLEVR